MKHTGLLEKMDTLFVNPVQYFMTLNHEKIRVNDLIGKQIQFTFTGNIYCTICSKKTKKSFGEGLCFNCFTNAPENAECIIRPELCQAHEQKGRDVEWEIKHHFVPHIVYLALVNQTKVGVTRNTQIPTRWIDQGANKAIILAETPYRQLAGAIEVALKEHVADKTHWMKMLKNEVNEEIDLVDEKSRIKNLLPANLQQFISANNEILELHYPVLKYPEKIQSLSLDKVPQINALLTGIRGQYIYFGETQVLNIRKHSGYEVSLEY